MKDRDVNYKSRIENQDLIRNNNSNNGNTNLKQLEQYFEIQLFLNIANRHIEMNPLLNEYVMEIKKLTGCEAVGIRMLDKEGNIPYEAYYGFSLKFYKSESPLSIKSDKCMCINVIKVDFDSNLTFFTERGSFYMNETTNFLATVSEEEKGETRNVCNETGYESVALIPISLRDRILGLIHIADRRENMVPLRIIKVLEIIAMQLGTALQRVWTQQELKESEEKFRRLYNRVFDAIIMFDKDENIIDVNETAQELLDYSNEEFLKLQIKDLYPSDEINKIKRAIDNVLNIGIEHIEETALINKEGKFIKVEVGWTTFKIGDDNFIVGSFRDITDRKKREYLTQLMISLFSHDLKSPFTIIKGSLQLAQSDVQSPEIEEFISDALKSTLEALNLVNNSVALLKLSEQHSYEFYPVSIFETLKSIEELTKIQFSDKKLKINLINIEKNTMITADLLFERLLWNLISNSIKNDDTHEIVEIDFELKTINEKMYLILSDKGKGIQPNLREKLLSQRYSTFRKRGEGSGLGMWLINQLADRYGWTFSIESRVPNDYTKGSNFKFEISP